ncbi:hypothetical protein LCGC14_0164290 [marine sediment metagenome]|uniref:Uncharacterized protein n=1 Tax=marine sediment metagenome TaxID=412755 RepID=A0A0F9UUT5_9ZZZZ
MRKPNLTVDELLEDIECEGLREAQEIVCKFCGHPSHSDTSISRLIEVALSRLGNHDHPSDATLKDSVKFYQLNYYITLLEYCPNCVCGGGDTCSPCHWFLVTASEILRMAALVKTIRHIQKDEDKPWPTNTKP